MEANGKQVHVDSMDEEIVARVAAIDVAKDSGMVESVARPSSKLVPERLFDTLKHDRTSAHRPT